MHDIRLIRDNPEAFDAGLARRGMFDLPSDVEGVRLGASIADHILDLDRSVRQAKTNREEKQAQLNALSKQIGQAKAQKNEAVASQLMSEVSNIKRYLSDLDAGEEGLEEQLKKLLSSLPNLPDGDVPDGEDEAGNVEVSRWGTPRSFDFQPKEHADLGPALGLDFETGALISGARFTFLRGQMARLHRALGQFMLDRQTGDNGYTECNVPLLVKDDAAFGTTQLPKFAEDLFQTSTSGNFDHLGRVIETLWIQDEFQGRDPETRRRFVEAVKSYGATAAADRRWLIPTAEVSLTNAVREQILPDAALPMRMTALTPCFRSEAGAAGKDTRGFIRQHQFEKVELVSVARPDESDAEHERMTACAEGVLQALGLPYRKMLLCAGDMGFAARKTYDLEVWLPGQGTYREISSCSNCGDFQARRMNARYRPASDSGGEKAKPEFVHTLNGSGLAVGRTLVAVLENYQQEDGSVEIPQVLQPWMGGLTRLAPTGAA